MMNGQEKSDFGVVAEKPANKGGEPSAERVEPRPETKGNVGQQRTHRAQDRARVTQALDRVRKAARLRKKEQFTALLHHINVDTLRTAFQALRRKAAPGVDGVTWQDYEADLEPRLRDLHERVHRGAYRPQPSRRTYIPKADGKQRPLAIAALEDKIVQGACVMVLNAIYEGDFCGFSYGFRPGRGPHDALDALCVAINQRKVNWIADADIQNFFGAVKERGEPFLLPQPCGFPYAVQRLGHASPALCPVHVLLFRVSLGPRPWLHRLRHRRSGFVRRLHSYYGGVRLLLSVHHRLRLLAFPRRTGAAGGRPVGQEISQVPTRSFYP